MASNEKNKSPLSASSLKLKRSVSFIPSQLDSLGATSPPSSRASPLRLSLQDAGVLLGMVNYLPWVVKPFFTTSPDFELYLRGANLAHLIAIGFASILGLVLGIVAIPALLILPGLLSITALALGTALVRAICAPIQGPMIVHSKLTPETKTLASRFTHERWIFINGCCVANAALRMNCDRLSRTFGRPVMGIHNRTYGLLGDLMECIIQRAFSYTTGDCRYALDHVKASLADHTVKKVVLIGHSQGGIIISMILDRLFADMPAENIAKLEIYTFGSAAGHFNNPLHQLKPMAVTSAGVAVPERAHTFPATDSEFVEPRRVIKHIEHYCNEGDMVTRWGVLHCVKDLTDNRFAGRIFVHLGATGHMFNQHYLSRMFPIEGDAELDNNGKDGKPGFLDQEIDVDETTADKREASAEENLGIRRVESKLDELEMGDGQEVGVDVLEREMILKSRTWAKMNIVGGGRSGKGKEGVSQNGDDCGDDQKEKGEGVMTVKRVSRLWRYVGGGDPDSELSPLVERSHSSGMEPVQ